MLSSGKMSGTMVSVTLGAIPWASCARYVRCTRTDFPPQTRPPFQSSRRCVAGTVKFVKSRNSSGERELSQECEKLDADITPRSHPCGGTGCRHGGRCVEPVLAWSLERDYPEESSHSPPPSARLHSYSPPFDLHVGSNCGAAGPARHPGTSSAPPAAPRHSCISTLPASLAPSNTCKNNTNTNQMQVQILIQIHIKV